MDEIVAIKPLLIKRTSGRWTVKDKVYVVNVVHEHLGQREYILRTLDISEAEFKEWEDKLATFHSPMALRATRVQDYRIPKETV